MIRYIAVQHDSCALFAYVEVASSDEAEAALIAEAAKWTDFDNQPNTLVGRGDFEGDERGALSVYRVPDDIEVVEEDVDAGSVHPDSVFGDYLSFRFVGFLVREEEEEEADEHSLRAAVAEALADYRENGAGYGNLALHANRTLVERYGLVAEDWDIDISDETDSVNYTVISSDDTLTAEMTDKEIITVAVETIEDCWDPEWDETDSISGEVGKPVEEEIDEEAA